MYRKLIRYSNKIFNLWDIIASITDERLKPQISTINIVTAILCMQLSNLGSLNSLSQTISFKNLKKDIPSVSTIARSADSMALEEIRNIGIEIYLKARKSKMLGACPRFHC